MKGFVVRGVKRTLKWVVMLLLACVVTVFGVRAFDSLRGPPLEVWHKFVPDELSPSEIDAADWTAYLAHEDVLYDEILKNVTGKLDVEDRAAWNRYFAGSPINPTGFAQNYNRSFLLMPDGAPKGASVLLHGLTDSPYSMRHFAEYYRGKGFVAVVIRMPGHGTVPGGLTEVHWESWMAATRLAVREAVARAGSNVPLHLVGYSNGGALAVKYTIDTLDDQTMPKPTRISLMSPMIGITAFARFAGLAAIPAVFPAFVKASWLGILPEFNPFKYNSFPVNAARQSYELTRDLQAAINRVATAGRTTELPPILAFQSIVDFTVSTPAVVTALFDQLHNDGSELVLFDINRASTFSLVIDPAADSAIAHILPPGPRRYAATIIENSAGSSETRERRAAAGDVTETRRDLGIAYPYDLYSLSHIALPFPLSDGLYGMQPDPLDDFGVNLGALASRGEAGTLIASLDTLMRASSNPFFSYMVTRIDVGVNADLAR
ncbi:alpha/beta hydrolase [Oryzicola mucosus]|uniref:Alpha/beta fold hydrolase n=1 Tax=Oryzicola mucosus TaxID=2767425 RepID=A0A8J6PNI5_9HYPH|nr:alpha/beta hydrolase [Oryzicola mucosus]MBD0414660.1 alpha/beta fold hydrolase [Oryzicola mucosus]